MNNDINSTLSMGIPRIKNQVSAPGCSTLTDGFDSGQYSKSTFNGLPVKINITVKPEPTFMGGRPIEVGALLSCKAWTYEAQYNLGRVALHLARGLRYRSIESVKYMCHRYTDCKTEADVRLDSNAVSAECHTSLNESERVLDFLNLVTSGRKLEGTEEQWKEHFECIRKGKSNPKMPKHAKYDELCGKVIDTMGDWDAQKTALTGFEKKPNATKATKLAEACLKIEETAEQLYHTATGDFEELTGYSKDEFVEAMWTLSDEFCTNETLFQPEENQEFREMPFAEAYGMRNREHMLEALHGNLAVVKDPVSMEAPNRKSPLLSTDITDSIKDISIAKSMNQDPYKRVDLNDPMNIGDDSDSDYCSNSDPSETDTDYETEIPVFSTEVGLEELGNSNELQRTKMTRSGSAGSGYNTGDDSFDSESEDESVVSPVKGAHLKRQDSGVEMLVSVKL